MFGRLILLIGWLATAIFVSNAFVGLFGSRGVLLQRAHLVVGLAATMLLIFVHSWLAIYLFGVGRMLRSEGYRFKEDLLLLAQRLSVAVLIITIGNFVIGAMRLAGHFQTWIHNTSVGICLAVQLVALVVGWKAVRAAVDGIGSLEKQAKGDDGER